MASLSDRFTSHAGKVEIAHDTSGNRGKWARTVFIRQLLPVFVTSVGLAWLMAICHVGGSEPPLREVRTTDFFVSTTVVGELGYPLGKEIKIRGEWTELEGLPDGGLWLVVTHVNERKLDSPVRFGEMAVRPVNRYERAAPWAVGDVCELVGFEAGEFKGLPVEYYRELAQSGLAFPAFGEFRFFKSFEYMEVKRIRTTD